MFFKGCNWYGFGAIFFGCLSMLLHGTISYTRYKTIVRPHDRKYFNFLRLLHLCLVYTVYISELANYILMQNFDSSPNVGKANINDQSY